MSDADAQRALVTAIVRALQKFAESMGEEQRADEPVIAGDPPRAADEHALGKRQLQIVELPGLASEEGVKTADIAAAIDYELPNTYSTLQALARNQVVEQVPGKEPQHWRLVRRYRRTARDFARVAELVAPGEWTTAGDISIAVRGDNRAAPAIAAARLSSRVLADRRPPADVADALRAEGVVILPDGEADPRQRVSWDELSRRAAADRERRTRMAKGTLNYLQIPAADLEASATFYEEVFGWRINRYASPAQTELEPQTGYVGFIDSSGEIGGEFVLGRPPTREPGLLPSIRVDSIEDTLAAVVDHGGGVVVPRTAIVEGVDWQSIFRDPAGNAMALYEAAAEG
ncbi:MAG: VOC family protein [Chloroflexota bacterium]|nr:VOC family protein [Chloroflexota bacterium]